jgi:hypothetical protein
MRSLVLVFMAVATLAPNSARAQDDEALAKEIRAATEKATKGIVKALTPPPPGPLPKAITFGPNPQARPLEALALLRAGGEEERKFARTLLDDWYRDAVERDQSCTNYELALAISAYEGLTVERVKEEHPTTVSRYEAKPLEKDVISRLELLTRTLVAGRHGTFAGSGCGWSYDVAAWQKGETVEKPTHETRARDRFRNSEVGSFDNSNTQFSVLALHDAARAGIKIPADVVAQVGHHFLHSVDKDKRWGYRGGAACPSMTFAGLSSLGITRDLGFKDAELEKTIEKGLENVPAYASAYTDVPLRGGNGFGFAYDIYSLEKALDTLEVKEIDGKDWFAPIARRVLRAQGKDNLWGGGDVVDSCFYVLFLTRATISKGRLVDGRGTGAAVRDPLGEVYLPKSKKTVDAIALVRAYAMAEGADARIAADEAIRALEAEGHGREACLFGALAQVIRRGGDKKETGIRWTREVLGRIANPDELDLLDSQVRRLHETRDVAALTSALSGKTPIPVRAFAAVTLARIPYPAAAPAVITAVEALTSEPALDTVQGSRCARAFADSLASLTACVLPALPEKGAVSADALRAVARTAREKLVKGLDDKIDKAAVAYDKKDVAWPQLRGEVSGTDALARMVDRHMFRLLRAVTGELIPDDDAAWRSYVGK